MTTIHFSPSKPRAVISMAVMAAKMQMMLDQAEAMRKLWIAVARDHTSGKKARVASLMNAAGIKPSRRRKWNNGGLAGGSYDNDWDDLSLG